jgi:hypothetical protein
MYVLITLAYKSGTLGARDGETNASQRLGRGEEMQRMENRLRVGMTSAGIACVLGALCALLAIAPAGAVAEPCLNAAARTGFSADLPDCRAYEQVSPQEKNNVDIVGTSQASSDGSRIVFLSPAGIAETRGVPSNAQYLSARTGSSWSTLALSPLQAPPAGPGGLNGGGAYELFSEDLSTGALVQGDPALVPGAPSGRIAGEPISNLYLSDFDSRSNRLLTPNPPGVGVTFPAAPVPVALTRDLSHVVFESLSALAPGAAPNVLGAYDYTDGAPQLLGILPSGTPAEESYVGASVLNNGSAKNAMSDDGSLVYFGASGEGLRKQLFLREDDARSVRVSVSDRAVLDPAGPQPALFASAARDGSAAYFTSAEELTEDANTGAADEGNDLYRYDAASKSLTDVSVDHRDSLGAQVQGVVNTSEDAGYVYFVALGQLVEGSGTAGAPNLYVWHAGKVGYIATLSPEDSADWFQTAGSNRSRVTPDGNRLLFLSQARLKSYDNAGHVEAYLYDASSSELLCVSCNPSGVAATGNVTLSAIVFGGIQTFQARNLSDDGTRVFFNTPEALVASDVNGQGDAYEWEQGALHLISSGQAPTSSGFVDASASGDDVFILTRQSLAPTDEDDLVDLYDARVNGETPTRAVVEPCSGESCHGPANAPPVLPVAASTELQGAGNLAPSMPGPPTKVKVATKAKRLAAALKACRKHKQKSKRRACEKLARKRYAPPHKAAPHKEEK